MQGFLWRWALNAAALYFAAYILDGINIDSFVAALVAALIWGVVNTVIRPLINLITLPINIMTLGLFTLVVNGFLLWLVAEVVKGFSIDSIWVGIVGALLLSIISSVLSILFKDK
ncbi:MAG: phage holin family protein [Dethiobacter sp.]|nr:phage holin family protein [Dethiobacter sp.]MBS3901271.1 phage holin family protein [Dethiobacter sp.]MBS3990101.1 phage holin family protein [Dethiobacter sp.]